MERPIILKAHEIRGILDGGQTQLRRVLKNQPAKARYRVDRFRESRVAIESVKLKRGEEAQPGSAVHLMECPFGQVGDRLWGREKWGILNLNQELSGMPTFEFVGYDENYEPHFDGDGCSIVYAADGKDYPKPAGYRDVRNRIQCNGRWRASLVMPRWASRILLEIVSVRVERLHDISESDALAHGVEYEWHGIPVGQGPNFVRQWISDYGTESWDANPWVWVVEFKRVAE